jgi:hypothetical protein
MSAVLSATCSCGRRVIVDCPTIGEADWAAAHAAVDAAGFVWHERLGYRCNHWPGCATTESRDTPPVAAPSLQQDLFAGAPS